MSTLFVLTMPTCLFEMIGILKRFFSLFQNLILFNKTLPNMVEVVRSLETELAKDKPQLSLDKLKGRVKPVKFSKKSMHFDCMVFSLSYAD